MPVDEQRERCREEVPNGSAPRPTRLHERYLGVVERSVFDEEPLQEVGLRHEIGVEEREEVSVRVLEARGERAGLVALPVRPAQLRDRDAAPTYFLDRAGDDLPGLVRRVVEHLDVEAVLGRGLRRRGPHDLFGRGPLVVEGDLDRHGGRNDIRKVPGGAPRPGHGFTDRDTILEESPEHSELDEGECRRQQGGDRIEDCDD